MRVRGADVGDLRAEQLLDRALDLDLVRGRRDLEDQGAAVLANGRGLLGESGRLMTSVIFMRRLPSTSCSLSSAASGQQPPCACP